jgi:hypothetical protein
MGVQAEGKRSMVRVPYECVNSKKGVSFQLVTRLTCESTRKETPMGIVALERMFKQLEVWGQDPEDSRFGDLSTLVTRNLQWVLEESFDWEAREKAGCSLHERSDGRTDYRNGYRFRDILTRFGRLKDVRVPRLRYSGFIPSILQQAGWHCGC